MKCSPKIKYIVLTCIISMVQVMTVFAAGPKSKIGKLTSQENEQQATNNNWLSVTSSKLKVHSVGIGIGQTFLFDDFEDNGDDSITADLFYMIYYPSWQSNLVGDHSKTLLAMIKILCRL